MSRRTQRGFALIEVLLATLLMTIILGALASVTAQWLPNWNRGMTRVQRLEKLALGLDRIAADLAVAEMVPPAGASRNPLFAGGELSVAFVRTAVGPNARPGLETVRYSEQADKDGLAFVRERASLTTEPPLHFGDAVVLLRAPLRVSFAYAGDDRIWQPAWLAQPLLPRAIRVTVRDARDGTALAVSTSVTLRVDLPPDCARVQSPQACLSTRRRGSDAAEAEP